MTNETLAMLRDLIQDDAFTEKIIQNEMNADEMHDYLLGFGVDVSSEEIAEFSQQGLAKFMESGYITGDEELNDEELETVSGGAISAKKLLKALARIPKAQWNYAKKAYERGEDITSWKFRAKLLGVGFAAGLLGLF